MSDEDQERVGESVILTLARWFSRGSWSLSDVFNSVVAPAATESHRFCLMDECLHVSPRFQAFSILRLNAKT